jgi:UDP-N-acetylmuramoyl-L-alanyl-D-glutamate--2,6-diaminopimelate ligase
MQLSTLINNAKALEDAAQFSVFQGSNIHSLEGIHISDLHLDSRLVKEHEVFGVFVETPETALKYILEAVTKRVQVVIISSNILQLLIQESYFNELVCIVTENPRKLFAQMVAAFYNLQPLNCVAVTGTAGKTSVASLVLQLWKYLNISAASVGTLGLQYSREDLNVGYNSTLTTPDTVSIHKCLEGLKQQKIEHVVMEASSHGLHQHRLDGVKFKVAAFTNFSQDHLDYHKTMEAYFQAKLRLFEDLIASGGWAILNADIPEYDSLVNVCKLKHNPLYSYGVQGEYVALKEMELHEKGQKITLVIEGVPKTVVFPLIGRTQVYNLMCALSIVLSLGAPLDKTLRAIEKIEPVPGRLNFAGQHPNGAKIYIDYAHKPQALELILKDIRPYSAGKVHLLFGCGGDRDTEKRPIMGEIAEKYADVVVITDDNPRTEDATEIRKAILNTCPKAIEIGDRRAAIEHAIKNLNPEDVLVVAGKGHERYQIIGHEKIPLDDFEIVSSTLESL